ncbi:MAG: transposase [Nanoarchaeota archaeon]
MLHTVKWIKKKLQKLFAYLFGERKAPKYVQPIIDAACNKGYVESYSNKADSLHLDIRRKIYEEDLQTSFLKLMNSLAKHFRKDKVRLAVDFQEQGFYGKTNKPHIIGTAYKKKPYKKVFKFLTVSILTGNKDERIPLYALPWHIGQDLAGSVEILLSVVRKWFSKIEVVQFDRGFFSKELIYSLIEDKFPYLIHIPKYGKYLKKVVAETDEFHHEKYKMKFNVNKSTYPVESILYVCKNIKKKNWLFLSSLKFKDKWTVRNMYRNRWQIETNYAVHNSARIMSRSTDYIVRYFYYLVDVLLQVLWRLCACKIPIRTFLFSMVVGVKKMLEKKPHFAGT